MTGFDSNVLVYACDQRDPRRQKIALELLRASTDGVLLWQTACEFIAASRKLDQQGFTKADAWQRLGELMRSFPLIAPNPGVLDRARTLHVEQHWSYWDAMIVGACLEAGVSRFYSEDLPGRAAPPSLEIVNPFA